MKRACAWRRPGDSVVPVRHVLGTVPVEEDGSAYFRVPANKELFFQALNEDGTRRAVDAFGHARAAKVNSWSAPAATHRAIACQRPIRCCRSPCAASLRR